jgi:hypothetical protein
MVPSSSFSAASDGSSTRALELPEDTDGNIFRLRDGRVMVTMVSTWRQLRKDTGYAEKLQVVCRLPDAAEM